MTVAKGYNAQILVGSEATYKTTPATFSMYKIPFVSESLTTSQNLLANPEIRSNRNPASPVLGGKTISGNIQTTLHLDASGWPLFYTLGAPTSIADGAYGTVVQTTGSGLSDLSVNAASPFTGSGYTIYEFEITTAGAQDKFKWTKKSFATAAAASVGTATSGAQSAEVNCAAGPIAIEDGLQVVWGAITGHVLGDKWQIPCVDDGNLHTFKPASSLTYCEVERGLTDTADYFLLRGCIGESLGFKFSPEGVVTIDWGVMGSDWTFAEATESNSTTTYTSEALGQFQVDGVYRSVTMSAAGERSAGTALTMLPEVNINWKNNSAGEYVIGGDGAYGALEPSLGTLEGSITEIFEAQTILSLATAQTESSLLIGFSHAAGTYWGQIVIPELLFQPQAVQIGGTGILRQTLPWKGYYADNTAQATSIQVRLFNSVTSYS